MASGCTMPRRSETLARAAEISDLARISFWDALIVASAEEVDADELLSEGLNPGQSIVGIRVVNPLDGGYMGHEVHGADECGSGSAVWTAQIRRSAGSNFHSVCELCQRGVMTDAALIRALGAITNFSHGGVGHRTGSMTPAVAYVRGHRCDLRVGQLPGIGGHLRAGWLFPGRHARRAVQDHLHHGSRLPGGDCRRTREIGDEVWDARAVDLVAARADIAIDGGTGQHR